MPETRSFVKRVFYDGCPIRNYSRAANSGPGASQIGFFIWSAVTSYPRLSYSPRATLF
jgi:hypothetical protein